MKKLLSWGCSFYILYRAGNEAIRVDVVDWFVENVNMVWRVRDVLTLHIDTDVLRCDVNRGELMAAMHVIVELIISPVKTGRQS